MEVPLRLEWAYLKRAESVYRDNTPSVLLNRQKSQSTLGKFFLLLFFLVARILYLLGCGSWWRHIEGLTLTMLTVLVLKVVLELCRIGEGLLPGRTWIWGARGRGNI